MASTVPFTDGVLPPDIRSRLVPSVNRITVHVIEAGFEVPGHPVLLLLHGFPELAYSWRKVMLSLADAGYHVVAPDVRGYGRTDGTEVTFDDDIAPYSTMNKVREANEEMWHSPQGIHAFTRGCYHHKSGDWPGNRPHPLATLSASQFATLAKYYVMDLAKTMSEIVAAEMPSATAIEACTWLPDRDLAVYAEEYGRNGYQGGFQGYRCVTSGLNGAELSLFAGHTIDVPAYFISGACDWGNYQTPGAFAQIRPARARTSAGCISLRARDTGLNRSNSRRSADCS